MVIRLLAPWWIFNGCLSSPSNGKCPPSCSINFWEFIHWKTNFIMQKRNIYAQSLFRLLVEKFCFNSFWICPVQRQYILLKNVYLPCFEFAQCQKYEMGENKTWRLANKTCLQYFKLLNSTIQGIQGIKRCTYITFNSNIFLNCVLQCTQGLVQCTRK